MFHKVAAARLTAILAAVLLFVVLSFSPQTAASQDRDEITCDKVIGKPKPYYLKPQFETITEAINELKSRNKSLVPGYTLCVLDGTYEEQVVILDDGGKGGKIEHKADQDNFTELAYLKIVAFPDGNQTRPIIDGRNINFRNWFDGLVWIKETGIVFQGFEVKRSNGRGISIGGYDSLGNTIHDITIKDVYVHDNWADGIVTNGQTQATIMLDGTVIEPTEIHRFYPWNIRVENSNIFRNGRKARVMPVIFEGRRIEGVEDPNAWEFVGIGLDPWAAPFWQGKFLTDPGLTPTNDHSILSYLPGEGLDAISVSPLAGNRVLISSTGRGTIPAAHANHSGKDLKFDGADVLQTNQGKWEIYFNGDFIQTKNPVFDEYDNKGVYLGNGLNVDGFEVDSNGKLLVSFDWDQFKFPNAYLVLPGMPYPVYPGDLLVFNQQSLGIDTKGTFSFYRGWNFKMLGFGIDCESLSPSGGCIKSDLKDFAFDPSGALVARIERDDIQGEPIDRMRDIRILNGPGFTWRAYMNAELKYPPVDWNVEAVRYQFNPMGNGGQGVSIVTEDNDNARLFVTGRVEGTVGLGFTATGTSWAVNNHVHENYGEGLSVYFNAQDVHIIGNTTNSNLHSNIYINDVQDAVVDSNFVYCTDDLRFWAAKSDGKGYKPNNGIGNRDEDYGFEKSLDAQSKTLQSSWVVITNNIVVGCNSNLEIARQANGPGLKDSLDPDCKNQEPIPMRGLTILHNTFVEARGYPKFSSVSIYDHNPGNDQCEYVTPYINSAFTNNLISQGYCNDPADKGKCQITNKKQPAGLDMRNNLYQFDIGWTQTAQQTGDPFLVLSDPPNFDWEVLPEYYQLRTMESPAHDNAAEGVWGLSTSLDFFGNNRFNGPPDIGAHEFNIETTCNRKEWEGTRMVLGDVMCGATTVNGWTDSYQFSIPDQGYVMAAVRLTDFNTERLEISIKRANGEVVVSDWMIMKGEQLLFTGLYKGDYIIELEMVDHYLIDEDSADYELTLTSPLLVSAAAAGLGTGEVAGIRFQSGDILAWSALNNGGEKWWMFFDASDMYLVRNVTNVAAGDPNHPGSILIGIAGYERLPYVGEVKANDIIAFDATRFGSTTTGSYSWVLKGSDADLTTAGERIDGLDGWVFGYEADPGKYGCFGFPISTMGFARVKGWGTLNVIQDNEDVFCKVYDEAAGGWRPWDWFFDVNGRRNQPPSAGTPGKVPGLVYKNVFALSYDDPDDLMYLTVRGNTEIEGVDITQKDIFSIEYPSYEWVGIVWSGPDHGWDYKIDAFEWDGK